MIWGGGRSSQFGSQSVDANRTTRASAHAAGGQAEGFCILSCVLPACAKKWAARRRRACRASLAASMNLHVFDDRNLRCMREYHQIRIG